MRLSMPMSILTALMLGASATAALAHPPASMGADHAFQFRLGGTFPAGDSQLWDDNEDVFTLDVSDFDGVVLGLTFLNSINNDLEIGFNADFSGETVRSEYRFEVDESGFPILHDTELSLIPLTVDVRFVPGGRYRIQGSRQVLKPAFYLGGGLGMTLWEYEEVGDFIDFSTDPAEIFSDRFVDSGTAFEVHALAGVELPVGGRSNLLLEARRSWADDDLGDDFAGLGEIDLGGTSIYAGVSIRF